MRIEVIRASAAGTYLYSEHGYGFMLEPYENVGDAFPVKASIDAVRTRTELLDSDRPLWVGEFGAVEFSELEPESYWLLHVMETPADMIGARSAPRGMTRLWTVEFPSGTTYAAGTYYLTDITTTLANKTLTDVRRWNGVLLTIGTEPFIVNAGVPTVAFHLSLESTHVVGGVLGSFYAEDLAAGSSNDWMSGGVGCVGVGSGFSTTTGTLFQTRQGRWPYVSAKMVVAGGAMETDGDTVIELWGVN